MTLGQYRRLLDVIMQGVLRDTVGVVLVVLRFSSDREVQKGLLAARLLPVIREARVKAHSVAIQFLHGQAEAQGVRGPIYEPGLDGYSIQALETVLDKFDDQGVFDEPPQRIAERVGAVAMRHSEESARSTIVHAVEDETPAAEPPHKASEPVPETRGDESEEQFEDRRPEDYRPAVFDGWDKALTPENLTEPKQSKARRPVRWARVLTGADNCPFCVMLASRGAAYTSKEKASTFDGKRYHDHCDCVAVPVYTSKAWPGKADADALYKLYLKATKHVGYEEALKELRKYLVAHPDALTGLVGDMRDAA